MKKLMAASKTPSQRVADASIEGPAIVSRPTPPSPTLVFDTYWRFAAERQEVYFRRLAHGRGPWTNDPILSEYKFTNAYRAADRVSQYLIRNVIYGGRFDAADVVFRVLLFKIFNKIETWELLESRFGPMCRASFEIEKVDAVLSAALRNNIRIYSAAYIMPNAPKQIAGSFKHRSHLELLFAMLKGDFIVRLLRTASMKEGYELLLSLPSIGPFLAYQYIVDLNYSVCFDFDENDFVQPGPGALNGLRKCFSSLGDYSPGEAVRWVAERQEAEFASRDIIFKSLWGRALHLIDCQNLFCEVDKYSRVAHPHFSAGTGRARIKQKFKPLETVPAPWFPPKWKLTPEQAPLPAAPQAHFHALQKTFFA